MRWLRVYRKRCERSNQLFAGRVFPISTFVRLISIKVGGDAFYSTDFGVQETKSIIMDHIVDFYSVK